MRSPFISLLAATLALSCADVPSAPLLQTPDGSHAYDGKAPPPWAETSGEVTTDGDGSFSLSPLMSRAGASGPGFTHTPGGNVGTYRGWLLVTPRNNGAILRFAEGGTNITFSKGAMIMKMNGKVSGKGTMTVGGHTYQLSTVDRFEANGDCAITPWDYQGPSCASFSDDDGSFSSQGSVWTGVLSNDIDGVEGFPGCTSTADFVVSSQTELSSALAAGPGNTIALNGLIEVPGMVVIQSDDIRLTCAAPGSGLISATGSSAFALLHISGDGVRVDNLVLSSVPSNGVGGAQHPIYAFRFQNAVEGLRLSLNEIRCGNNGSCGFLVGAPGAVVSDNTVQSLGTTTGIHVQLNGPIRTDQTVVERNEIIAPTVSGSPLFGAIRVRDGDRVIIRHNSTSGAWRNGIAVAELDGASIENNSIRGAQDHGIVGATNVTTPVSLRNSVIRENRIDGPQAVGIGLMRACWNRVEHNDVRVGSGTLRAKFEASTGGNVYVGSAARVVDQGNLDCDGNGFTDPNTISGSKGASTSNVSGAQVAPGSLQADRLARPSGSTMFPELQ